MKTNTIKSLLLVTVVLTLAAVSCSKKAVHYSPSANEKLLNNDVEGAIAGYTKAIDLNPRDLMAYHNRGYAKQLKKDFDGAIADYTKAIELGSLASYYTRAYSKQLKEDWDGAIADYTILIEHNPAYAEAYLNRGLAKKTKATWPALPRTTAKPLNSNRI